ncbi:MAG TPA: heme o synthase [Edaphocola sp.]|nr:heme o synthase [Edaphocola sp.]
MESVNQSIAKKPSKLKDYFIMSKANLSFLVVFSSLIGYFIVPGSQFHWPDAIILGIGGSLTTISSNIINQIIERDSDKFMKRTKDRPLPQGRMGLKEAWILVFVTGIIGVVTISYFFNFFAGMLGLLSLLLYGFAYTPMKKKHQIATFIGAIPGAMPPLIGWVAATNSLSGPENYGAWALLLIQFFWQFPHFWAIAWLGYEDYDKAGIRLLPTKNGDKTKQAGMQCIYYTLTLIPVSILPNAIGLTGVVSMYIAVGLCLLYFGSALVFYLKGTNSSAKGLLYASIFYLPIVLLALLYDKI